jgi:CRP-like cAMP-binding protein
MSIHSYQLLKNLGLSEGAVLRILPTVNEQVYRAEQVIYRRAMKDLPWTHIAAGLVCAYLPSESVDMAPFCVHPQGDWFGETDVVRNSASTCEYVCLTDVRLKQIPGTLIRAALQSEPQFEHLVLQLMAARHQRVLNFTTLSRIHTSELRVILGLSLLVNSLQAAELALPSPDAPTSNQTIEIPIKQSILASLCGVSRSALSIALRHPTDAGLCRAHYGRIVFMRLPVWEKLLGLFSDSPAGLSNTSGPGLAKQAVEFAYAA